MLQQLREVYASILLRPPFLPRRWKAYFAIHMPILTSALKDSAYARLLTFRTLDAIHRRRHSRRASKRLHNLYYYLCPQERPADQALYYFLAGMYMQMLGRPHDMARRFQASALFKPTYHLIYAQLGEYEAFERCRYDRAALHLDQAIDCVYKYPPLDDAKRLYIAVLQAGIAYALVMLHRTADAEAALAKAAPAAETPVYLHALAFLRAVQGRGEEAQQALNALRPLDDHLYRISEENIRLILEGTHPRFTAKEPDHAAIAAYWEWFAQAEPDLRWHLSVGHGSELCYRLHEPHFAPLAPEPAHIDRMSIGILLVDGKPQIHIHDHHSKNYAALLDAFTAACPPDILSRWEIVRNPEQSSP